jgi:putative transposase
LRKRSHIKSVGFFFPRAGTKSTPYLKATSSKHMWTYHQDYLSKTYYQKRVLWTGSYFVSSCGGVTIETLRKYIEQQDRPSP